jgi:hypothetical protein
VKTANGRRVDLRLAKYICRKELEIGQNHVADSVLQTGVSTLLGVQSKPPGRESRHLPELVDLARAQVSECRVRRVCRASIAWSPMGTKLPAWLRSAVEAFAAKVPAPVAAMEHASD